MRNLFASALLVGAAVAQSVSHYDASTRSLTVPVDG
jgi:hypothetical protein